MIIVIRTALAATLLLVLTGCQQNVASCPPVLGDATRLVLVITPSMDDTRATLRTFERATKEEAWAPVSELEPAVVGTSGLAWGHPFVSRAESGEPEKREGDKRTPAGIYAFGATFGFEDAMRDGHLRLASGEHYCVDDVRSPHYGRIISRSVAGEGTSGEEMAAIDVYKRGIVIDYPPKRQSKAGSCIFVHIWEGEGIGTSACVALAEARVAHLQKWAKADRTAIAILPEAARSRFKGCLPQ
jgi:L,D-peptidoglycan transpeptidase YkuD (ErfK/YbiS/YcfS/YnhG family)